MTSPWSGQIASGRPVRRNSSRSASPSYGRHPSVRGRPDWGSIQAWTTVDGAAQVARVVRASGARTIMRPHTGAARRPPVAWPMIGRGSSKPIHTAATTPGV